MKSGLPKAAALAAGVLIISCSQGPTAPTAAPAAAKVADGGDGRVGSAAAGDVKNGPIEIDLVRVAQGDSIPAFYANAGGQYTVRPNRELEIYVQIWRSDRVLAEVPRLIINWGVGEKDNLHCGPCRLSHTYAVEGKYTVTVTMDDRVGGVTQRTFVLDVQNAPVGGGAPVTQSFSYSGGPVAIPDSPGANVAGVAAAAPITVSGLAGVVTKVTVSIDGTACNANIGSTTVGIDHTFVNDLVITLRSPSNTDVVIINRTDGGGNNLCQVLLGDGLGASIQTALTAQAPFTGSWAPNSPLSAFAGEPANGVWTLLATDFFSADTGTIRAWTVTITAGS